MKKYIKSIAIAALALGTAAVLPACSEDKVYEVNVNAIPLASDYADAVQVDIDQNTNIATLSFNAKGVYPVWIIDGKNYSTAHSMTRFYRKAGDYVVELKVGNGNGISQGALSIPLHFDKTQMSGFGGFVYDSPFNMWLTADRHLNSFWYAPGWNQIADPAYSFDGETMTLTLPEATTDQWQAQMHLGTDICLNEGEQYDGSFIFTSTMDMKNVTLKIHPDGDDDDNHSFFCNSKINLTAGEPQTFWFKGSEAVVPMNNLVFTFDFGGNPAGVEVTIENFVIKRTADDDGTITPEISSEPEPAWVDVNSAENLWSTASYTNSFYYAPGWNQIADPVLTFNGKDFTVALPSATFEQWQAQVQFATDLSAPDTAQLYDFCITLESNNDIGGVMVKLTQSNEVDADGNTIAHDGNFFFAETTALAAGMPKKFWMSKVSAPEAMHAISLVLDFGGNPDNTEVNVSNIIFQVHHD
ncbi:MAG: hypothetical protein K2M55_03060 [Muribaculaceae bacterium]|nr:hypothetical protein [Muribaculaceae bacterium]